ncbi:hypothetical protein UMNF18_1820 [Escherichia coli UMNF18]|nr:hypothetical protein UMNF18_1820 [Escherichia coli UMNF18]EII45865.1 hypothetical protein EC23916_5040 [Escherichia coli 2.3916]EMU97719.1 hypothetical protein ECMP0210173_1524 [Escherichia coli MP021017.3]EMX42894.1 hypothetical protein ECMP0210171_1535 [Escherichia coli MP021017.1]ENA18190.1 hypothetical protein ECBCE008MS13_1540 [Escherichia coli BCE008_MS-13]
MQHTFDVSVTVSDSVFSIQIPEYGDGIGYFLKDAIDQKYVKLPFIYSYATTVIQK